MLQSSKMSLHLINHGLSTVYRELLSCYMKDAYWRHNRLADVDPTSQVNCLPVTKMYMGTNIALLLSSQEYIQRAPDVQYFLNRVQELYIEAASQVKKRFPINVSEIEMLEVLDPLIDQAQFPSLVPLASRFPNLIPQSKLQVLDNQWRRLRIANFPIDRDVGLEEFWENLSRALVIYSSALSVISCGVCYLYHMQM